MMTTLTKKTKRLTATQVTKILNGFAAGTSVKTLASRFRVTTRTINNYYKRWNAGTISAAGGTVVASTF